MNRKRLFRLIAVAVFALLTVFALVGCVDDLPTAVTKDIATTADFLKIADYTGDRFAGSTFRLTADLDFSEVDFVPVGTLSSPFTGTFDGGDHKITGVQLIDEAVLPEFVGLFGAMKNATVKNLTAEVLVSQTLTKNGNYLGGIAGAGWGDIALQNVKTTFNISNRFETTESINPDSQAVVISTDTVEYAGGIIGYVNGNYQITGANVEVRINETATESDASSRDLLRKGIFFGGIAGYAKGVGIIDGCSVKLNALDANSVSIYAGGAVGYLEDGTLNNVEIELRDTDARLHTQNLSSKAYMGGIAGYTFQATVKNSKFASDDGNKMVLSTEFIGTKDNFAFGGAVGYLEASVLSDCNIKFRAQVKGGSAFGGVVGIAKGSKIKDAERAAEIAAVTVTGVGFEYDTAELQPYLGTNMFVSAVAGIMRGEAVIKKCAVDINAHNAYGKSFTEQDVDDDGAPVGNPRVPLYTFEGANQNTVNLDKLVKKI